MSQTRSTAQQIELLSHLLGTKDLNEWEQRFVGSLKQRLDRGQTTGFTDAQIERLEELHDKHFA